MSQGFKLRFDQMRESNPVKEEIRQTAEAESQGGMFHAYGYARNLCLVWQNGKQSFFNYAYLISAELDPDGDINVIRLNFSSHDVTIKGYCLEVLFAQLLDHLPRLVIATDPRYIPEGKSDDSVVIEIQVESKN